MGSWMNYFENVNDVIGNFIKDIKADKKNVVLFGAGYCLSLVLDLMEDNDIKVIGVCDNNKIKIGQKICGKQIEKIEEIQKKYKQFNVVISTSHFKEIKQQLLDKGFENNIFHLPISAYYKNSIYGKNFVKRNHIQFSKVFDILEDDISKKVFVNVIRHNISLDPRWYQEISDYEINGYFGTDLYKEDENAVIIDGGAFDGDTYREFLSNTSGKFAKYVAYEPDTDNYNQLKKINDEKLITINKGLGEKSKKLYFTSGMGVSSNISEDGDQIIEVGAIDQLNLGQRITFIKMDIEGAEKDALYGAKKIIMSDKPTLAISAYHKKEDLYDLVNLIKSLNNDYKIYLRHTFYYQKVMEQPDVIIYAI